MEPENPIANPEMNLDRDEFLVEAVRSHRCLWDTGSKLYRDRMKKEQAWVAVSSALKAKWPESDADEDNCRKSWKKLRDYYVREKKKIELRSRSGAAGGAGMSFWSLYSVMDFLRETVTHRNSVSNIKVESCASPSSPSPSPPVDPSLSSRPDTRTPVEVLDLEANATLPDSEDKLETGEDRLLEELLGNQPVPDEEPSAEEDSTKSATSVAGNDAPRSEVQATASVTSGKRKRKSKPLDDVEVEILAAMKDIRQERLTQGAAHGTPANYEPPAKRLAEESFCRMVGETLERLDKRAKGIRKVKNPAGASGCRISRGQLT